MKHYLLSLIVCGLHWPSDHGMPLVPPGLTPSPPELVAISAATYQPPNRPRSQWVELRNRSSQTVDLSRYVLDSSGDPAFAAPNLRGRLEPGQVAIVYDVAALRPNCGTTGPCDAALRKAWPELPRDAVLVPLEVSAREAFPSLWMTDRALSLWPSLADYLQDTNPSDRRAHPQHAVASVASTAEMLATYSHRADPTHEPILRFPWRGPMGESGAWTFSADDQPGAAARDGESGR